MKVSHYDGHPVVVESRRFKHRSWRLNPAGEEEESQHTWGDTRQISPRPPTRMQITKQHVWCHNNLTNSPDDQQFPKKQEKIRHFIQHHHPEETRNTREKRETGFFRVEIFLSLMCVQKWFLDLTSQYSSWADWKRFWLKHRSFSRIWRSRKQKKGIHWADALIVFHPDGRKVCVPWCKRFCWWTWWISPDTRNSISDNTWWSVHTGSEWLHTHTHTRLLLLNRFICVVMFFDCSSDLLHFNLWSIYSRMILTICTSVRIKAPNASEPTWYLMRRWQISNSNNEPQIKP